MRSQYLLFVRQGYYCLFTHFNWELTANVTAGPWKGRKMKSGSNKEVAILQGHRRKRDLFEGLVGNFPHKVSAEGGG